MSAQGSPSGSGATFDDLAADYAEFRTGYADEVYGAIDEFGIARGGRVLDLGCGTGIVTRDLAERGFEVVGVDVSEPMLDRARRALDGAKSVSFAVGAAEHLPFADASFDAATSAQSFHWFERERALAELARVVRPGGTIAVWWKSLMRGDTVRLSREEAAHEAGVTPTRDVTEGGFPEFEAAPLEGQILRVIPWLLEVPVDRFMGYERSRARSKIAYGERLGAYLDALERRLRTRTDLLELNYIHFLYLARVPGNGAI